MRRMFVFVVVLSVMGIATLSCTKPGGSTTGGKKKLTIAVIPKGTTHEFWKSIHAGAIKAQQEFGSQGVAVSIIWKGPLKEDDRENQIQVVENFGSAPFACGVAGEFLVRHIANGVRDGGMQLRQLSIHADLVE